MVGNFSHVWVRGYSGYDFVCFSRGGVGHVSTSGDFYKAE